jgi:hypothetical protein
MKSLIFLALLFVQLNTHQEKPVVHLLPNRSIISVDFGGKVLELINAPPVIYLPAAPPKPDADGHQWVVDVKNLGPAAVTIQENKSGFSVPVAVNQTVHIYARSRSYSLYK